MAAVQCGVGVPGAGLCCSWVPMRELGHGHCRWPTSTRPALQQHALPLAPSMAHFDAFISRNSVSWKGLVRAQSQAASDGPAVIATATTFKHVLLPILDSNPYLSEATRQAAATTTALATKYGADITVVVIDEKAKESLSDHDLRLKNIRWHLAEGGFENFGLMEKLGEGKRPAAVIGEVADDLQLDLVVLSMEAIHSKHIDGNLLAEFVPCPVLLLPL